MNNRPVPELQTDPEFDELIQPREEKYLEELEENIFDHGCLEPVCVWNGIILDGRLRYIVTGCSLHDDIAPDSGNYRFISADICQMGEQSALFREVRPNIVINTSALSVPDYCEAHREEADSINVNAVGQLAFRCEASAARFIHLSTDFVFNGDTGQLYTEAIRN